MTAKRTVLMVLSACLALAGAAGAQDFKTRSDGGAVLAIPLVGQEDLTFCYGWNDDLNQCQLYLGSRASCDHVTPCIWGLAQDVVAPTRTVRAVPRIEADTFCYGFDEDMNQCLLYFGTEQTCNSLPSC